MKGTKILAGMMALLLAVSVTACGRSASRESEIPVSSEVSTRETENTEAVEPSEGSGPLVLDEIPEEYLEISNHPGQVMRIDYESNTYDEENRPMDKYA